MTLEIIIIIIAAAAAIVKSAQLIQHDRTHIKNIRKTICAYFFIEIRCFHFHFSGLRSTAVVTSSFVKAFRNINQMIQR